VYIFVVINKYSAKIQKYLVKYYKICTQKYKKRTNRLFYIKYYPIFTLSALFN